MLVYLDYAAATPVSSTVQAAMQPYFEEDFYNPSGLSLRSAEAKKALDAARDSVAQQLNTSHRNVVFTAGGSEANNLVLHGVAAHYPACHMLVSAIEHDAILNVMPWLSKWFDINWDIIPVDENGVVILTELKKLVRDDTKLVSVMHINNETGVSQPLNKIRSVLDGSLAKRVYLHSDASQSPAIKALHFDRLGADAITLNGGKIYGPKQSGALVCNFLSEVDPLIVGGGQEQGLRAGTESLANIVGFATALRESQTTVRSEIQRQGELQRIFESALSGLGGVINSGGASRSPSITSVMFSGVDAERLLFQLEQHDIIAASGSACSARDHGESHILSAMGLDQQQSHSTVRFSFGRSTTLDQLDHVISILKQLLSDNT